MCVWEREREEAKVEKETDTRDGTNQAPDDGGNCVCSRTQAPDGMCHRGIQRAVGGRRKRRKAWSATAVGWGVGGIFHAGDS